MTYTKAEFGQDLKERVQTAQNIIEIGRWAHKMYLHKISSDDMDLQDIALTLNTMELGPEFALSYEKLEIIADDLIAGREVKLR